MIRNNGQEKGITNLTKIVYHKFSLEFNNALQNNKFKDNENCRKNT